MNGNYLIHILQRRATATLAALLCTSLSLPACHMTNSITTNGAVPSHVPVIAFKGDGPAYAHRNPNPKQVYELVVQIENAPGSFKHSYASISMSAKSAACAPYHDFPIGAASIPSAFLPFQLEKVSDTEYRGVFATDPLINETYWEGKPPCEWNFVAANFSFSATGLDGETGFNGSINTQDLSSGLSVKRYYWKGHYPKLVDLGSLKSFSSGGSKDVEQIRPERRKDLFTITATARKMEP